MLSISKAKIFSYFKTSFVLKRATNGWWSFDCPFCIDGDNKKKHAVHFEYEVCKCWALCGHRSSIIDFVMQHEGLSYRDARLLLKDQTDGGVDLELLEGVTVSRENQSDVTLPHGYNSLLEGEGILGKRAREYLSSRGFDIDLLDSKGFGYCNKKHEDAADNYFGYIIIPFKSKGKLQYFIGRDYTGNFLRYKNPGTEKFGVGKSDLLFNEEALEIHKRCFVSEGWSDAMTMGKSGTATMGWSLSTTQKGKIMRSYCEELVFVPDFGMYQEAVKTAMDFIDVKKKVVVVNLDLIGTKERKDANELGYKAVYDLYKETKPLDISEALNILV